MNDRTPLDANELQNRTIIEQVATAAVEKFALDHPELSSVRKQVSELHPGIKLAGAIITAVLTVGVTGSAVWVVTSINDMKETLARMDERQLIQTPAQEKRFVDLEVRVGKLENDDKGIRQ